MPPHLSPARQVTPSERHWAPAARPQSPEQSRRPIVVTLVRTPAITVPHLLAPRLGFAEHKFIELLFLLEPMPSSHRDGRPQAGRVILPTNTFNDIGGTNFRPVSAMRGLRGQRHSSGDTPASGFPPGPAAFWCVKPCSGPFRPNGHGGPRRTTGNTPRAHCRTPRGHVQDPGAKSMTLCRCLNSRFDEPCISDSPGMAARERAATASRRRR